jgi:hypothetical protein
MDKSKIPAFLQDRKKLLILCIVAVCTIVYTFNSSKVTINIINVVGEKTLGIENVTERVNPKRIIREGLPDVSIPGIPDIPGRNNKGTLSGTYKNLYANEILSFKAGGKFVYSSGPDKEEGTFQVEDDIITLHLGDWEQSFTIVDKTNDTLVLFDGGNYYYYSK